MIWHWLEFAGVVAFIAGIGLLIWEDVTRWYSRPVSFECIGCRKGRMKPGCPAHDENRRAA